MSFDAALNGLAGLLSQFAPQLDAMLLVFARVLAFLVTGPVFNRRNIPIVVKVSMAVMLTGSLWGSVSLAHALPATDALYGAFHKGYASVFYLQLAMNVTVGVVIGFIASMVLEVIYSAGNLMNNQIGLSSAVFFDPASGRQTMVLESLFSYMAIVTFMELGGLHWMVLALQKSFVTFPLLYTRQPLFEVIDMSYFVGLSGDVFTVAVQMMAPVLVVTMAMDLILGIVNRAAQQMPVFQLSFALKPAVGVAVLLMTLPIFVQTMVHFLSDYADIF
ncbi:MAG: flagellar biosynthetic protein FliR [Candidatus Melainabacteria bacterium]